MKLDYIYEVHLHIFCYNFIKNAVLINDYNKSNGNSINSSTTKTEVSQAILRDLKAKPHSLHEACKTHRVLTNQIDCCTWFKLNKSGINSIKLYICTK